MITTELIDGAGTPFSDLRNLLPRSPREWQPIHRIRLGSLARWKLFGELHAEWDYCFLCGGKPGADWETLLEIHHLPLRSDERTALVMLCRLCHRERVTREWFPRILWAKWRHDQEGLSWARLSMVYGRYLPEPEAPPDEEFWRPGFEKSRV